VSVFRKYIDKRDNSEVFVIQVTDEILRAAIKELPPWHFGVGFCCAGIILPTEEDGDKHPYWIVIRENPGAFRSSDCMCYLDNKMFKQFFTHKEEVVESSKEPLPAIVAFGEYIRWMCNNSDSRRKQVLTKEDVQ
jgi:hypothetical protein